MYDVIVIGAGPAGSAAAAGCAREGLRTLCIEEHGTIGFPVQCAGLLSNAAFEECRVSDRPVLNHVSGARIVPASGNGILIDGGARKAVVVDRGALDREMAEHAADAGSDVAVKTMACGVRGNVLVTRGADGRREFPFRLLIAADGPRSRTARLLHMPRPRVFLGGIQAEITWPCDPGFVELYPDASPDFFGWMIPSGRGRARIGLCSRSAPAALFRAFRRRFPGPCVHLVTGTLPLGLMEKTYGHHTLFVGDAAGFAKPTSGGGVYTGIRSARHAALTAAACCERDLFTDAALADYERRWKKDLGRDLELGFRIFQLRQGLDDTAMDALIRCLDDPEILRTIVEHGDMDRPGPLVRHLMTKPAILRYAAPLLRSGLTSLLGR